MHAPSGSESSNSCTWVDGHIIHQLRSIQVLEFSGSSITAPRVVQILQSAISLVRLELYIDQYGFQHSLLSQSLAGIDAGHPSPDQKILCPKLEEICISQENDKQITEFIEMIKLRQSSPGATPIRSISFYYSRWEQYMADERAISGNVLEQLQEFARSGVASEVKFLAFNDLQNDNYEHGDYQHGEYSREEVRLLQSFSD